MNDKWIILKRKDFPFENLNISFEIFNNKSEAIEKFNELAKSILEDIKSNLAERSKKNNLTLDEYINILSDKYKDSLTYGYYPYNDGYIFSSIEYFRDSFGDYDVHLMDLIVCSYKNSTLNEIKFPETKNNHLMVDKFLATLENR